MSTETPRAHRGLRLLGIGVAERREPLDKQIAATALIHDLVVVSRNVDHFAPTGVRVLNPFT